jgi:hypothetical protein
MKTIVMVFGAFCFLGMVLNAGAAEKLQHVVCLKFKSTATSQDIKNVEQAFEALQQKIPQVMALQWGTNVSKEQRSKGFTHCYILSFKSDRDLQTYLDHPEHKAFGKTLAPVREDVFVIDFWAKD